jgi:NAD(P)-dependent dehydrogenase (short-subunit alcohol dehydrogenase family)
MESGFGAATTTDQIIRGIELSGKNAIVTGGYSGLGRETVRVLRGAGARVIVPTRDIERARKALREIPGVEIEPIRRDALCDRSGGSRPALGAERGIALSWSRSPYGFMHAVRKAAA